MAISCQPADLAAASACYRCIPSAIRTDVIIYILQQLAGDTSTASELLEASAAYRGIQPEVKERIITHLFCRVQGCDPDAVLVESACMCGSEELLESILIYVLITWENGGEDPDDQGFLLEDDGGYFLFDDGGKVRIQT